MSGKDTEKLLNDCRMGCRTGMLSLGELEERAKSPALKKAIRSSIAEHLKLSYEAESLLGAGALSEPAAAVMARGMSWLRTETAMALNDSDSSIAGLVTDGCAMGIKSLNKSLNACTLADAGARSVAGRIIAAEENLAQAVRSFL